MEYRSSNTKLTEEGLGTQASPFMISMSKGRFSSLSDSKGRTVRFETNEFGAITKRINALGGEQVFTRDENNNVTNSRDENGNNIGKYL